MNHILFTVSELSSSLSLTILSTHKRIQKLFFLSTVSLYLFANVISYAHVLFINAVYTVSLKDALLWMIFFPLNLFYMFYGRWIRLIKKTLKNIFLILGYFWIFTGAILTVQILHICQQFQLKQLNQLNEQFLSSRSSSSKQKSKNIFFGRLWRQFISVNRSVIELAVDISHRSAFWSPSLTIYFFGFITFQCYLLYIVAFVPTLTFFWRSYFTLALVNWTVFQIYVIQVCSVVVRCNGAIERANRKFYLEFFLCAGAFKTKPKKLTKTLILKAEWLQSSHRLRPYCMVLLDNYRITSQTFYLVSDLFRM